MPPKTVAPYGTWDSPITTDIVSGNSLIFAEVHADQSTGAIYLIEGRPSEKGRQAIVRIEDGETIDILPKEYSARSKVHEYGGAAAALIPEGNFIFTDHATLGVFSLSPKGEVYGILPANPKLRYADFDVHPTQTGTIIAIQEDHIEKKLIDAVNTLVVIDARNKKAETIVQGADFYSHPKFSPDGTKISWLQWNHPDMPWTGSELYFADWQDGKIGKSTKVAGNAGEESISEPKWHTDGTLLFLSDRTKFYQLYRYNTNSALERKSPILLVAGFPLTVSRCTYVPLSNKSLVATYCRNATNGLLLYDLVTKSTRHLDTGLVSIARCGVKKLSGTEVIVIGSSLTSVDALYLINVAKPTEKRLLKPSVSVPIPTAIFSPAQHITFPRSHGVDLGTVSHAIFVPPQNPNFEAPAGSKPPLIMFSHGGPTGHVSPGLALNAQYYTSRGFAYCYPNYAGSTGYGRDYIEQLNASWGIKDVEDTVSCIDYLASQGLIDGAKVGITGRSSGGYTTIQALCAYPTCFAAGVSLFGIGNLKSLMLDSHKFESHYESGLLFTEHTTEEEKEQVMFDRSPCFHADRIEKPLLLLQGDIDMVVPLAQATEMERVLKGKGGDVKLVVFEGEGHGFKMKENLKRAIEEEEGMWKRTLL
ncbi:hypothetical protein B2J93_8762 [Marssonina coronariae]|uniref:Peptidase S9 prolyl oligopeptidase catalytic domain-containing protein n=1 Tax=Diplocarpon coronariae TaxID=2795749 RepID=A0A218YUS8_9HELO|nr:hypothetical protein B2J93_8762 [Marssonina coronariae]